MHLSIPFCRKAGLSCPQHQGRLVTAARGQWVTAGRWRVFSSVAALCSSGNAWPLFLGFFSCCARWGAEPFPPPQLPQPQLHCWMVLTTTFIALHLPGTPSPRHIIRTSGMGNYAVYNPCNPCLPPPPQHPNLYITDDSISSYTQVQEDFIGDGQTHHSGGCGCPGRLLPRSVGTPT